jgi:hypothetical protein
MKETVLARTVQRKSRNGLEWLLCSMKKSRQVRNFEFPHLSIFCDRFLDPIENVKNLPSKISHDPWRLSSKSIFKSSIARKFIFSFSLKVLVEVIWLVLMLIERILWCCYYPCCHTANRLSLSTWTKVNSFFFPSLIKYLFSIRCIK